MRAETYHRPAAAVRRGGSDGSALSAKFTKSKIPRGIGHAYRRCEIYLLRSTCDDVSTFNPEPVARHRAAAQAHTCTTQGARTVERLALAALEVLPAALLLARRWLLQVTGAYSTSTLCFLIMLSIAVNLKGKRLTSRLLRSRMPKCELCEATRDSLRP